MAIPAGITSRYGNAGNDAVGIREDLEDIIYDITPTDTIFLSTVEKMSAKSTYHEWQVYSLEAATADNKQLEGDDFSATTAAMTTRYGNFTQIATKRVVVSGTYEALDKAGRDSQIRFETMKMGLALKRDVESSLLSNNKSSAGSQSAARALAGVESWIYSTQSIKASTNTTGTTPAPTTSALVGPTDGTATATVTEALLRSALQVQWQNGGAAGTLMMGAAQKGFVDQFTGIATRFRDVGSKSQAQIIGAADVYVSSYGSHQIRLSRFMRTRTILCLDFNYWGVATIAGRNFKTVDVAKTGDSEKRMILWEGTLVAKNPLASTKIQDLPVA
jgi:hypothetical protein